MISLYFPRFPKILEVTVIGTVTVMDVATLDVKTNVQKKSIIKNQDM